MEDLLLGTFFLETTGLLSMDSESLEDFLLGTFFFETIGLLSMGSDSVPLEECLFGIFFLGVSVFVF
jgi:hypothetical protein